MYKRQHNNQIVVQVIADCYDGQLQLKVKDEGVEFSENMTSGYGIRSIQKKLKLLFPDSHELVFMNPPNKHVFIQIPIQNYVPSLYH